MEDARKIKADIQDVTGSMGDDLARVSAEKAIAVAQVKSLQKENDRLRDVIKELTVEQKEGE